jgi:hypothetical protein
MLFLVFIDVWGLTAVVHAFRPFVQAAKMAAEIKNTALTAELDKARQLVSYSWHTSSPAICIQRHLCQQTVLELLQLAAKYRCVLRQTDTSCKSCQRISCCWAEGTV